MKKKLLGMLLCVAMVATGISGCGGTSTESVAGTEVATSESGEESTSTGEKIQIDFSTLFNEGEPWKEVIDPSVEKFNAEQDKYEIIVEEMPQDAYITQTNARGTADDLAELSFINGTMMKAFSETGVVIPLTDIVSELGFDELLNPSILAEGTNVDDGVIYSIPMQYGIYGFIYYNSAIFEEAGVETFPETMDEFMDACAKIEAAGYIPMALGSKDLWAADSLLMSAFVNNYTGNDWYDSIRRHDGTSSYLDEQFIAALTDFSEIGLEGYLNDDFVSISNDERRALYANGQAAMISAGDWDGSAVDESNPEIAEVTLGATWPGPATGAVADNSIVLSGAWGFAIGTSATEEQIEGIKIYLKDYFFVNDLGAYMIEEHNCFVAWDVDYDESKVSSTGLEMLKQVETGTGCMNWDSTADPTVKEVYQRGLQEILIGTMTPEELAQEMQTEYEMVSQ